MNAAQVHQVFDLVGDSPEAVAGLRRLIVALAVGGKFGVGEPEADFATLRAAIQKSLPVGRGYPEVTADDLPLRLNAPHTFVRLGAVAAIEKGKTGIQSAVPGTYPLVVTAEGRLTCDHFDFEGEAAIVPLVSSAGHGKASIQRLHFEKGPFALGTILAAIFPRQPSLLSPRFLFEYLSAFKDDLLVSRMIGTANVTLTLGKLAEVPVPIVAPKAQQRVDEVMALCDRLEAARAAREAARDRLASASLARLNTPDPDTFTNDARRALDALRALTARSDQIKELRQAILNFAVWGRLVPQDRNDGKARRPLDRKFSAASGMDNDVFEKFSEGFSLPNGWEIAPLALVSEHIVDCPHTTPKWTETGVICIRTNQLRSRSLDLSNPRYVSPEEYSERIERLEPQPDDILYSREGGILGMACRIPHGVRLCMGQRLMLIRAGSEVRADFLDVVLNSPFITEIAKVRTTGGAAPRVNMSTVRAYPIPLPPLAEQHRIVAKVDELMALCDQLEASLDAATTTRSRLLDALLAEALSPAARDLAAA